MKQRHFKSRHFETPAHRVMISIDTESLLIMRALAEERQTSFSGLIRDLGREAYKRAGLKELRD